jgi:hypothetical protein
MVSKRAVLLWVALVRLRLTLVLESADGAPCFLLPVVLPLPLLAFFQCFCCCKLYAYVRIVQGEFKSTVHDVPYNSRDRVRYKAGLRVIIAVYNASPLVGPTRFLLSHARISLRGIYSQVEAAAISLNMTSAPTMATSRVTHQTTWY